MMIVVGFLCFLAGVFVGGFILAALAIASTDDWESRHDG